MAKNPQGLIYEQYSEFATIGPAHILYHCSYSYSISVQYAEKTVFGSHGVYFPWTGTEPRNFDISANLVAGTPTEAAWNVTQISSLYGWTQASPPTCQILKVGIISTSVRIESLNVSVDENTMVYRNEMSLENDTIGSVTNLPIQINLSVSVKECRGIWYGIVY